MKKLIIPIVFCVVAAMCLTIKNAPASATHSSQSFLLGQQVIISNNVAITNNTPNVRYISRQGVNVQTGFTNNLVLSTNGSVVTTNFSSIVADWETDVNVSADLQGLQLTNVCITAMFNYTNIYLWPGMSVWPQGASPTNAIAIGPASTNTVTFTFLRQCDTTFGNVDASFGLSGVDTFTWAPLIATSNGYTISTNLPISFVTGARRIRLRKAAADDQSSPGVILNSCTLSGWTVIN